MSVIDIETKRKLREMGVTALADAFDAQDDLLTGGMPFAERISLIVDDAHASFTAQKIEGLTRRAGLRYPDAELRRLDLLEERGIDRGVIANLATCTFIGRAENVGSAEGLVESGVYAARPTASIIMASNSTGVSFPSLRCRRLR